jgi:hypothetical protein
MAEARAFAYRVPILPLLAFALVEVGCAPAPHAVRLRTADGQVRVTTPPPRPPMVLPKEEVHRAVQALAKKVVPVADPLEFARVQFEVPIREGVYILNARTKELKPADRATEATEEPLPELLEQARKYLQWCANRHQPGDCLGVLHGRRTLDAHGRYAVAMGIAIAGTLEATKDGLEDMVSVKEVLGMVVAGVTMYAVLWTFLELTTKGIATAITIVLVGYVGVHTLYTLGGGFVDLIENSEKATTFDALHDAGESFARVMGADAARILVMVATAAVGTGLSHGLTQLAKVLPNLPGAAQASELAVQEGAVALEEVAAVESVTIGKGGLTISLVNGAVLATSLSGTFAGGPRINLLPSSPRVKSVPERIQALKDAGVKGDLDNLAKRSAKNEGGALGELEAIERWLRNGIKGEDIEVLKESNVRGQTTPDCRVRAALTEIKTRDLAVDHRWATDAVREANAQIRDSGLDASRPVTGLGGRGPQGQVELQLRGDAARTGKMDVIEAQVREAFHSGPKGSPHLRRVAVYGDGQLIAEWVRTAANAIIRTFP